ncbi:catalase [Aureobasidium namibiae CBS 147.97]|uniref:Catalase n=1 Tax=Aureobasidium namibiae CBS 147.97 TaxID=1043004 RepID=A0A074WWL6_9PEZI
MAPGITETVKEAITGSPAENAKVAAMSDNIKNYMDSNNRITTDYGVKQTNTDDSLRVASADKTGPVLLEDHAGREKIHRFDHERIPERVVHARGAGAFGTFKLFESASDVSSAGVLTDTSRTTPVFIRFSTVLGSSGSADTVRDVRGFAVKFYTEEGNWDIVGNDIPVFFIQDALKFPDVIHSGKPEPHSAQTAHNNFWDFQYLHSEATHMFMWAMSDRGIPRSYRMMQGFGVNTYKLLNSKGESHLVKFHFTPHLGVHSFVWDEALKLAGQDPDFHRKDLWTAIEGGQYPKWDFGIQTIPESQADDFDFDPLDATKIWPEEDFPVRYIGELELNRNPDEYFTQTEQVAFCTGHVVPGIGFSDDPLLQGRNFSYSDTQLTRLGVNWQELPINKPMCPVMNQNRDGALRHSITKGTVNYWPNRFEATKPATAEEGGYVDYPQKVAGMKARLRSKKFSEHYNQAQLFYNSMSEHEKMHIMNALSFELDHCDDPIVYKRMVERLCEIDLDLARGVAEQVGADIPEEARRVNLGKRSKNLSQEDFPPKNLTIATRMVAILIADGYDSVAYNAIKAALAAQGALPFTIAPRRTPIYAAGESKDSGKGLVPDHNLEGQRSTMYDAIFVPGGADSIATLRKNGRALHYVREAFGHLKSIGATGEAVAFVKDACQLPGVSFSEGNDVVDSYGVVTAAQTEVGSFKEAVTLVKGAKDFATAFSYAISQHKNYQRELDGLANMVAY